jgi:hypothetical protein
VLASLFSGLRLDVADELFGVVLALGNAEVNVKPHRIIGTLFLMLKVSGTELGTQGFEECPPGQVPFRVEHSKNVQHWVWLSGPIMQEFSTRFRLCVEVIGRKLPQALDGQPIAGEVYSSKINVRRLGHSANTTQDYVAMC